MSAWRRTVTCGILDDVRTLRFMIAAAAPLAVLLASRAAAARACSVTNVTPMSFGTYPLMSPTPVDTVGELTIDCIDPTPVRIILGRGISGHQAPRELRSGGISLDYNLFADAARTIVWGDSTDGTQSMMGMTPGGAPLRLPIFGRIFALQAVPPGTYTDRIVVAVVF